MDYFNCRNCEKEFKEPFDYHPYNKIKRRC